MNFEDAVAGAAKHCGQLGQSEAEQWFSVEGVAHVDAERVFATCHGDPPYRILWDTRNTDFEDPELVVGLGASGCVAATGKDRFNSVRDQASQLLKSVTPLKGTPHLRVFGGFSFEPGGDAPLLPLGDARFVLPRWTLRKTGDEVRVTLVATAREFKNPEGILAELSGLRNAEQNGARTSWPSPVMDPDDATDFLNTVRLALTRIRDTKLEKVVVARSVHVAAAPTPESVLERLSGARQCVRLGFVRGGHAFVAATPELLVAKRGTSVRTEALAGSEPRRGNEQAEAEALLSRDKDLREHAMVVDAIRENLESLQGTVKVDGTPQVRTLRHVHHLATHIRAELEQGKHICDLVEALHPTPAMCGTPRNLALEFLREFEFAPRGSYAAPFGVFDANGDGEFVVGIRSALLDSDNARVYAGCGIVEGSDPELELCEVLAKQTAMKGALGLSLDHGKSA